MRNLGFLPQDEAESLRARLKSLESHAGDLARVRQELDGAADLISRLTKEKSQLQSQASGKGGGAAGAASHDGVGCALQHALSLRVCAGPVDDCGHGIRHRPA